MGLTGGGGSAATAFPGFMLGLGYGSGSDWSISGDDVKCTLHRCAVLYSAKYTNTRKSPSLCAPCIASMI